MQRIADNAFAWGKCDKDGFHRLAHHAADVAACFEAILALPTVRRRLEAIVGRSLSAAAISRLAAIAFLHDAGKLNPGFQAKGWAPGRWKGPLRGHVVEGAAIFASDGPTRIADSLGLDALNAWGVGSDLLFAALSHHGRPLMLDHSATNIWRSIPGYDPQIAAEELGERMRRWFPDAFGPIGSPLPSNAEFQHFFCGLVSLADWIGSDRRIFAFVEALDLNYIGEARAKARRAITDIGLDVATLQRDVRGRATFQALTGLSSPRPQQSLAAEVSLEESLVILEAETGSGKTEAALWRFARLFEAERVDSLYFALPTRAAAIQIHVRVQKALVNLFGASAPEAVLAVPGYFRAGEAQGQSLPDWRVRWEDNPDDEGRLMARWAAESAKRYLAATVAVGTVDQAMLAALQVKHAHLRSAALARSLLVIDEVHASDTYMNEVQKHLLEIHLARGGHAMLMSATLGSVARCKWLGKKRAPSFDAAVAAPYPAVWRKGVSEPLSAEGSQSQKAVAMRPVTTMAAEEAAQRAIRAAKAGARVLVARNTVASAVATFQAVRTAGEDGLLLQVSGGPALHHSRFAPEDRKLLDEAVETALAPDPRRERTGLILIGTQTLEQSLDIDADYLITDLCPVDVLLQRIGRLHRHYLPRPPGYDTPRCDVLSPERGLDALLAPAFENGLGAWRDASGVLQGVYRDLSILELTRRLVESDPTWTIPKMNRRLVESATHPDRIKALHAELGKRWADYWDDVIGGQMADVGAARKILLPVDKCFSESQFPSDEERIRTRLGAEGVRIEFAEALTGPFDVAVSGVTLPAHWSRGVDAREPVVAVLSDGAIRFRIENVAFVYSRAGLAREAVY